MEREYSFSDGKFFSVESGKCVAELSANGDIVFLPGFKGPHTATLTDWIERNGLGNLTARPAEPAQNPPPEITAQPEPAANSGETAAARPAEPAPAAPPRPDVGDIPEEMLPRFDPVRGVNTPGFREFVNLYDLDETQTAALIRRLERRK